MEQIRPSAPAAREEASLLAAREEASLLAHEQVSYDHSKFRVMYKQYKAGITSGRIKNLMKRLASTSNSLYATMIKIEMYRPQLASYATLSMISVFLLKLKHDMINASDPYSILTIASLISNVLKLYFGVDVEISSLLNYIFGNRSIGNDVPAFIENYKLLVLHKLDDVINLNIKNIKNSIILKGLNIKY